MGKTFKVLGLITLMATLGLWPILASAQSPPMTPQELAKYARGLKAELSLQEILDNLGYSYINVATDETGIELFPVIAGGYYQILYAEVAGHAPFTSSGWYPQGAPADTHIVFTGDNVPGDTAYFTITGCDTFGLYLNPENQSYIWYTESDFNSDSWDHSWIFHTHDPREFIVGWEDLPQSQSDADYQDLVVLFKQPNQPPMITCPGAQTVDENSLLSFVVSATDVEGDSITLRAEELPSGATFPTTTDSGSVSSTFNWTPDFCQAGVYTVRFIATDNYSSPLADTGYVVITVNDVNQAPTISNPGPQMVDEGQLLTFQLTGSDPDTCDGDSVHIYSNDLPPGASLSGCWGNPITKTFSWTPDFCQDGTYYFHFIVEDSHTLSPVKKDTVEVAITVNDVDRPPEISDPGAQNIDEGQLLTFPVIGLDPDICEGDTDKVELIAENLPDGATFSDGTGNPVTGTFEWTPNFCQVGVWTVRFIARNTSPPILADTVEVTITVNDVNQPPVVTLSDSSWTVDEGIELIFDVNGSDPDVCDGDLVTLSVVGLPYGANFTDGTDNPVTGTFSWTPNYGQAGVYTLTFIGTDDHPPSLADSVEVTITVGDVNQGPEIAVSDTNPEVDEGNLLTLTVYGSDPDTADKDDVVLSVQNLPPGATFSDGTGNPITGTFEWTPNFLQGSSVYTVTFIASDIHTKLQASVDVQITVSDVNRPPVVTLSDSSWMADEGVELTFDVNGSDPDVGDGDQVTLSVVGLPYGADFTDGTGNPVTGGFTWTPNFGQAGVYTITFIGTDDHTPSLADSVEVTITVGDVNQGPQITNPGPQEIDEGDFLSFTVTGSDPDTLDKDDVVLSVQNLPPGATFTDGTGNPITGTFEWTPDFCQGGKPDSVYTVTFIASDIHTKLQASVDVKITVYDVNRPPVVTLSDSSWTVDEGVELTFDVQGSDPDSLDGDQVTLSLIGLPSGTNFTDGTGNPVTGTFTWTPNSGQAGVYTLTFIGTDDHTPSLADSVEVTIDVRGPYCFLLDIADSVAAWPGELVDVPVSVTKCSPVGGYDVLIKWDCTLLDIITVKQKYYYVGADSFKFEFFNWHYLYDEEEDLCAVRVVGLADKPNDMHTPPMMPGVEPEPLFDLVFEVSPTWDINYSIPLEFLSLDCGDNTLSDSTGYILYTNTQLDCPVVPIPPYPDPHNPQVELDPGFIYHWDINDAYAGDINLNGTAYEVGDATMYLDFLKRGDEVLIPGRKVEQTAASDVNRDGTTWSIADVVMLVDVINGFAEPLAKTTSSSDVAEVSMPEEIEGRASVAAQFGVPVGGAYFVIDYSGEVGIPMLAERIKGMDLAYADKDGQLKVIIYSWESKSIEPGSGPLFSFSGEGKVRFDRVEFSDAGGSLMKVRESVVPTRFALDQNYPNPFNPTTTIGFDLPEDANVSLTVYNISGQKVAELVQGVVKAGHHMVSWNGAGVSSGVYFYTIKAGNFLATRKMVLMK